MALRHVILGLLLERPSHPYELKRRLSPGLPRERLINEGILYPLLARLEREGLVEKTERKADETPGLLGMVSRPRLEHHLMLVAQIDALDQPALRQAPEVEVVTEPPP